MAQRTRIPLQASSALAFGLIAFFSLFVALTYYPQTLLAVMFGGLIAVMLGIFALASRSAGAWAALVGLVAGVIAVSVSLTYAFLQSDAQPAVTQGVSVEPELSTAEYRGVIFDSSLQPADSADASHQIIVYVDYRCPHCLTFEQDNSDTISELLTTGQASLEVRPLTFLDEGASNSAYSARAASLLACTVTHQPEATWATHRMLLSPSVQPSAPYTEPNNEELIGFLESAHGAINSSVTECLDTEEFLTAVQQFNGWVFQHPIPEVSSPTQITGTPTVVVDGEVLPQDQLTSSSFRDFVTQKGAVLE